MKIHTYPDPVLKTKAEPIEAFDEELQCLIDQMAETMYQAPGIGLAANQVGVLKQVIVYDVSSKEDEKNLSVLINPEIISEEGEVTFDEACLSVVDYSADVIRYEKITVRGLDRLGNSVEFEANNLLAICLQHEIDHLHGILFIDRISHLKRSLYQKKIKKILKEKEAA